MTRKSNNVSITLLDILDEKSRVPYKLHNALLMMLEECRIMTKKEVVESEVLNEFFQNEMVLIDRPSVISWIHIYSPIRISLDSNGNFRKVGWKKKKPYVWDIEGARNVDWDFFYKGYAKRKEAAGIREALTEQKLRADKEIADYISRNPIKEDQFGKFGVPQDKYRWGFYGHKTMEFDVWGKGEKFS